MSNLPADLEAFLRSSSEEPAEEPPKLAPDIEAELLRGALACYRATHHFFAGMIVRQKPDARLYGRFGDNDLGIVVEVLAEPVQDERHDSTTPYYRAPLDLRVGYLTSQGGRSLFPVMYVASERFEPVPAGELALIVKERK